MKRLRRWVEHPGLNMLVAIILVLTSLSEGWETMQEDVANLDFGVHHGTLVLGLTNLLKTLPDLFEAAEIAVRRKR